MPKSAHRGGKGLLVPLKNLYVRTKAVQHIVQHGAVAVQHHPLRRTHKGVNGILCLLLLRRLFAAGLVQYPNIRHAVNAVQPRVRIVVGDADKVIVFVGVHHLIGAESVGRRRMLPFVISVVQVIQGHFLLACNGLIQLLNIPKNLPVTGLMSLPGDGQMAILFPLVDTELLLQFLDKLLGLPRGNKGKGVHRVRQQKNFRLLQLSTTEVIAHAVILVKGDVVTELDQKSNSPVYSAAVDFDTVEGLHLCNDLPHGQNVFRIGILL